MVHPRLYAFAAPPLSIGRVVPGVVLLSRALSEDVPLGRLSSTVAVTNLRWERIARYSNRRTIVSIVPLAKPAQDDKPFSRSLDNLSFGAPETANVELRASSIITR